MSCIMIRFARIWSVIAHHMVWVLLIVEGSSVTFLFYFLILWSLVDFFSMAIIPHSPISIIMIEMVKSSSYDISDRPNIFFFTIPLISPKKT